MLFAGLDLAILPIAVDRNMSQLLSIVILTTTLSSCVEFGSAQPAIADLIFSGDNVTVRWQTECNSGLEMYDIIYGCSQGSAISDDDLRTESYATEAGGFQPYREKQLQLPIRNSTDWKCVFRLRGQYSSGTSTDCCSTRSTPCYLIDSQTFREIQAGININYSE